jgi:HEAT repeat protein
VVPVDELPDEHRALLEAYGAGGEEWEAARGRLRSDPGLLRFAIDNLVVELVRAHDALVTSDVQRARRAYDRAGAELVRLAPESVAPLVELRALADAGVAVPVGGVLGLLDGPPSGAAERVAGLLDVRDVRTRRRAARLLGELPPAGAGEEGVVAALGRAVEHEEDWSVRAEAARALGVRAGRGRVTGGARVRLERALQDPDVAVARCAAEGLGAIEDPLAVPALTEALARAVREGDLRFLRSVQGALQRVTGVRRELDLEGWRRWWREEGGAVRARAGRTTG